MAEVSLECIHCKSTDIIKAGKRLKEAENTKALV